MADLSNSVEAILDAFVASIEAQTGAGQPLDEVESVVRGDRARPLPALPSVWVVPQLATMQRNEYGDEDWVLPVSIAALVQGDEPEEAGARSQSIAAKARSAALGARAAANTAGAEVTDIVSTSFDPTARSSERNRTLFWTEATVTVTFTVDE